MSEPARAVQDEEPIHVQVARALGYPKMEPCEGGDWHFDVAWGSGSHYREEFSPIWRDLFGHGEWRRCDHEHHNEVPRYDTDPTFWTGILEREKYSVSHIDGKWRAHILDEDGFDTGAANWADTPGVAVCRLFIRFHP